MTVNEGEIVNLYGDEGQSKAMIVDLFGEFFSLTSKDIRRR